MATKKKKAKTDHKPVLSHVGHITRWSGDLWLRPVDRVSATDTMSIYGLSLHGAFVQPLLGSTDFELFLRPLAERPPPVIDISSVGSYHRTKPFQGSVDLDREQFRFVVTLAAAGRLASVSMDFQTPARGHGLILNAWFGTDPDTS